MEITDSLFNTAARTERLHKITRLMVLCQTLSRADWLWNLTNSIVPDYEKQSRWKVSRNALVKYGTLQICYLGFTRNTAPFWPVPSVRLQQSSHLFTDLTN